MPSVTHDTETRLIEKNEVSGGHHGPDQELLSEAAASGSHLSNANWLQWALEGEDSDFEG